MNAEMQKEVKAEPHPKHEIRFVYLGRLKEVSTNSKNEEYVKHIHQGVTCVGYQVDKDGDLIIGVSFCSPEDEFSKKKARMIIKGRMIIGKIVIMPDIGDKSYTTMSYEELIAEIRECVDSAYESDSNKFAGVKFPLWFKGA